jgi:hypothetical protein
LTTTTSAAVTLLDGLHPTRAKQTRKRSRSAAENLDLERRLELETEDCGAVFESVLPNL